MSIVRFIAALAAASTTALAASPIEIHGSQFVNSKSNGRLQLLGVDYQPGGSSGYSEKGDPLSNPESCLRDAALMQKLGINTVRVYNISPELNHDECVSIFNGAGIYLILDVNSPLINGALHTSEPWTTYNKFYLERIFSMVEAFKDYPNVIGFFGGNEVINENAVVQTPSYVKAVQRDLKNYMKKHSKRQIPVGYSAADIRQQVPDQFHYLTCDDGLGSAADFFGMNVYSWCGDSSYTKSGYDVLTNLFRNTPVPIFFSEYGCNEVTPRQFTEVGTIFGDKMSEVWSGGLVYEWTQEQNEFGLVKLESDGSAKLLVDYDNLQAQFAKLDMKKLQSVNSTGSAAKAPKCDPKSITSKGFATDFTLPKLPPGGQELIDNGVKGIKAGKIIEIPNTKVKSKVVDTKGNTIKNLELKIVDDGKSNTPGTTNAKETTARATATATSTSNRTGTTVSTVKPTATTTSSASTGTATGTGGTVPAQAESTTIAPLTTNGAGKSVEGSTVLGVAGLLAFFM
ncbi:hypothetical protein KEM54_006891 [Ascosphaera aggregata]|nr:hypothetical protein KEM54_006891 [Ascosphaera aggregata]